MPANPLTSEVSKRICSHMNQDHSDAVLAYAKHYGNLQSPIKAKMLAVTPNEMELEVDGRNLRIKFDHTLLDSEDAHRTLVAMLKSMPKPKK
tara:strand:- start:160 stop:435 length:276 start_codon:yes stop_codon:yes gene_type:complete